MTFLVRIAILASTGFALLADCGTAAAQRCRNSACRTFSYPSTITNDVNGPLDLRAFAFYPRDLEAGDDVPVAVVMHGFSPVNTFGSFRSNAEKLANEGFVAVLVAMRGRDGSDGVRDSGGLEIHDIYDAVEFMKTDPFFSERIDPTNVHITGYSGGGGNVMSALTRFPDYFRLGSSYFGISDYGFDPVDGWYVNGANVGGFRTPILDADVGDPTTGDPAVLDRYLARASNLASKNNPYSEVHLFVNDDEVISPPWNSSSYRDNAVAAATSSGEFDNITLHVGKSDGSLWVDLNDNGVRDPEETQSFPHGDSDAAQIRGEAWYLDRLKAGAIPQPQLAPSDELFVAGWVRTKPFELWLGDGQNAAATLAYELTDSMMAFAMAIESNDVSQTGRLTVDLSGLAGDLVQVEVNDLVIDTVSVEGSYVLQGVAHNDRVRFVATIPEPTSAAIGSSAALLMTLGRRCRQPKRGCRCPGTLVESVRRCDHSPRRFR